MEKYEEEISFHFTVINAKRNFSSHHELWFEIFVEYLLVARSYTRLDIYYALINLCVNGEFDEMGPQQCSQQGAHFKCQFV